jgi:alkyl hydroperoxide reductase subunit F
VAAAIYAARKKIKTVIITDSFGGQSIVSNEIANWIGEPKISGFDLAQKLEVHLRSFPEIEINSGDLALEVKQKEKDPFPIFEVLTKNKKVFETKTVLLVCGSSRRKLNVPGEKEYEGKGVFYCATCDAPFFAGKDVAVVGGGNSALEAAFDLTKYAQNIYLLVRRDVLKGDEIMQAEILENSKVKVIFNSEVQEIFGDGKVVLGLRYLDKKEGKVKELKVNGVFVEIGNIPNSYLVKDLVELNELGEIKVDCKTQKTSAIGIWAAGDVTDVLYKQNNISVGDAIKAVLNIYDYLKMLKY